MTFQERCAVYGYPEQDPNFFKRSNQHWYVAAGCVVFMVFGAILHYNIAQ